jgi:hypothetical protein
LGPDEVGSPVVYCFDYSEELEFMGIVVLFGGGEGCQVEGYWVVLLCGGWLCPFILREDGLNSVFQHVSLEIEHFVEVRLSQNQFADHFVLKFFEGLLLVVFPVPRCGLFGEVQEGVCYLRIVFDEVLVVTHESEELLDLSHIAGSHLSLHPVNFGLFHLYYTFCYLNTRKSRWSCLKVHFSGLR